MRRVASSWHRRLRSKWALLEFLLLTCSPFASAENENENDKKLTNIPRDMISHRHGGSIILTASMSGSIVNYPQVHAAYGTSKAAVLHLTRLMAAELAVHKIRVNSISPGYMDTRLNAGEDLTDVWKTWWERTPMGRIGNPEELVGPVVLLASEAGSFMTGSDVKVDGGYCLT